MSCLGDNEVAELVAGGLDDDARRAVLNHLDECDVCREVVAHAARGLMPTVDDGSAPSTSDERAFGEGTMIGRYRVLRRLGAGAMGLVLEAEHVELRRRVALKVVLSKPEGGVSREQLRARLLREARAVSAIRHDNVVTVHDVLVLDDGSPVMVMDLLEGETLRERLQRGRRLTVSECLEVAQQLLTALEAAHEIGVVHRDLKPDNIFLARGDGGVVTVKVVDFGIAKLTALDGPAAKTAGLTHTGMLIGTPHYMAPEQAFGEPTVDRRADLWAVGVILYECLCGRRPFEGTSVGQVLKRLAQGSFRPVDGVVTGVPPKLSALIGRLLSERELRPQTATDVLREIRAIEGHDQPLEVTANTSPGGLTLEDGSTLRRLRRRHPWPLALSLAAVVVVGAGWTVVTRSTPEPAVRQPVVRSPATAARLVTAPVPASSDPANVASSTAKARPRASSRPAPPSLPPPSPKPTATASAPSPQHGAGKILSKPPF